MIFSDILYSRIEIPDFYLPFIKMPEFVRLRGVRLSNVDSFEFKDFNGPSRWEHSIGVLNLALYYSKIKNLSKIDEVHLCLAALLHDVATPPFAHTIEYIFENFDHEFESFNILNSFKSDFLPQNTPIFSNSLPKFFELCKKKSRELRFKIQPNIIAEYISGDGELGYLINGTIDLDNIDNVLRSSTHMGIDVDKKAAYLIVKWLSEFNTAPNDIYRSNCDSVKKWISYRTQMYSMFFNSNPEELGRQAFLQHIIRRAFDQGMSKESIIWNTDDSLLAQIESLDKLNNGKNKFYSTYKYNIGELVQRYRLLESVSIFLKIQIERNEALQSLKNPLFATWLEKKISSKWFEPFVIINEKRYKGKKAGELFQEPKGEIIIFHLASQEIKREHLPEWLQSDISINIKGKSLRKTVLSIISTELVKWLSNKPWTQYDENRKQNIISNLDHYRDWSFFSTRNQSLHSYPGTFVQSIPSSLISALGLKGEMILDTFGGTGQTATEAIKHGCQTISIDSNSIASLIAKTKFTYLSIEQRDFIKNIKEKELSSIVCPIYENDEFKKWHHQDTIRELSKIISFINSVEDKQVLLFLKTCFSAILTSCTARKGKDYAYFADNTPLPKELKSPPYISPFPIFLSKIKRNLSIIENLYNSLDDGDTNISERLSQVKIIHSDFLETTPEKIKIKEKSVKAIITSPPYLCMIDYTLGQRLSYMWLYPDDFSIDYKNEIGRRRDRNNPKNAITNYYSSFKSYAEKIKEYLQPGGYLVTVLGAPQANSFKEINLFETVDSIFLNTGFELFWNKFRPISWHRNRGHAHLNEERIAIYILNKN